MVTDAGAVVPVVTAPALCGFFMSVVRIDTEHLETFKFFSYLASL